MSLLLRRLLAAGTTLLKDILHQNWGTVTGSPTLIAGALTDGNQALRLSSTDTWTIADSVSSSLAIADAAAGGMAMSGWFSVPSIPGSTQTILGKVGSYELKITSAGKLQWILTNGANTVTVTSATTILPGGWYHFAGVYNGDYTGTPLFGNNTTGSALLSMPADYHMGSPTSSNNLQVCKFTALEKGAITTVLIDMKRVKDATLPQNVRAVVFGPSGAAQPGAKLGESDEARFLSPDPARAFVSFALSANFYPGDVWLGFEAGGSDGNSNQLEIGHETSGGTRAIRNDDYSSGAPDPFGTVASSDAKKFAIYANYTPTGRTGAEGKALIYLNGREDASSAYAHGIADSANALTHPAGVAVDLDDWAIWNKKLTPVQVATHFAAR